MRKVWVLDTSTKGTGASVVPLESARGKAEGEAKAPVVPVKAKRRTPERQEPVPRAPRRFKIVDVVSRETLAEGALMRATLDVLEEVRSPVDVRISVWDAEGETWRPLTLVEHRRLWEASRAPHPSPGG
jgi:hypothetical protein